MTSLKVCKYFIKSSPVGRDTLGITVSYWKDLESIIAWKMHQAHLEAQQLGKSKWYSTYKTRICKVERDYEM